MRRILICSGVLGGGTAVVFGAAAVTATLIPATRIVPPSPGFLVDRVMPANAGGQMLVVAGTGAAQGPDVFIASPVPKAAP